MERMRCTGCGQVSELLLRLPPYLKQSPVFTKCKQSLKDGRRLENMSWRLWYREMSTSPTYESSTSGNSSPALSDVPITPVSENGPQNGECSSMQHHSPLAQLSRLFRNIRLLQ